MHQHYEGLLYLRSVFICNYCVGIDGSLFKLCRVFGKLINKSTVINKLTASSCTVWIIKLEWLSKGKNWSLWKKQIKCHSFTKATFLGDLGKSCTLVNITGVDPGFCNGG